MVSDTDWQRMARLAREHLADVQNLIQLLDRMAGSAATLPQAKRRGRPPGVQARVLEAPAARQRPPQPAPQLASMRTVNAIRAIIGQDGPLPTRDILARLEARGWHPSANSQTRRKQIDKAVSALWKRGALRRVNGSNGAGVYGLAVAPPQATAKLAAAQARIRSDVSLIDRIAMVLRAHPESTVSQIVQHLQADGWRTSSDQPENVVRMSLRTLRQKHQLLVDNSGEHLRYRMKGAPGTIAKAQRQAARAARKGTSRKAAKRQAAPTAKRKAAANDGAKAVPQSPAQRQQAERRALSSRINHVPAAPPDASANHHQPDPDTTNRE